MLLFPVSLIDSVEINRKLLFSDCSSYFSSPLENMFVLWHVDYCLQCTCSFILQFKLIQIATENHTTLKGFECVSWRRIKRKKSVSFFRVQYFSVLSPPKKGTSYIAISINNSSKNIASLKPSPIFAPSAGAIEYTDCFSAER